LISFFDGGLLDFFGCVLWPLQVLEEEN